MGILGQIFGTEKAISSVVDSVSAGLDKLVYTDEEKADAAAAERSEARKMVVSWMEASKGQNLARRLIALSITGVWLGSILAGQVAASVAIFSDDPSRLHKLSELMAKSANDMSSAVMLILAFYFAAPHMGDIAKVALNRFGGKTNGNANAN